MIIDALEGGSDAQAAMIFGLGFPGLVISEIVWWQGFAPQWCEQSCFP
jgi:hypothetical protein